MDHDQKITSSEFYFLRSAKGKRNGVWCQLCRSRQWLSNEPL